MMFAVCSLSACDSTNDNSIQWMPVGEAKAKIADLEKNPQAVLIADPRSPQEFAAGHIPGAKNIQLEEIQPKSGKLAAYAKYSSIIVYGSDPNSVPARGLAKRLLANSYSDVYVLQGGLKDWESQGGEVVKSADK
ncbi:MAG: rhodanese-like domain-containing protein [Planctomycetes bacterium]|nr:rhodanese-like domain-containing protein [Planctomycetota bacterium]